MAEFWCSSLVQLTNNVNTKWTASNPSQNWAGLSRAFRQLVNFIVAISVLIRRPFLFYEVLSVPVLCSAKPTYGDVIGIDLGAANSCAAVMEGNV